MIGVTYLIVVGPLVHLTNFSVGRLEYMYEDISSSVLASPKAYVILITAAFIGTIVTIAVTEDNAS